MIKEKKSVKVKMISSIKIITGAFILRYNSIIALSSLFLVKLW